MIMPDDCQELSAEDLIVHQVSAMVSATAEVLAKDHRVSGNLLDIEARLYRILATNCEDKARMTEELAKEWRKANPDR
jgi:hypothetical protein